MSLRRSSWSLLVHHAGQKAQMKSCRHARLSPSHLDPAQSSRLQLRFRPAHRLGREDNGRIGGQAGRRLTSAEPNLNNLPSIVHIHLPRSSWRLSMACELKAKVRIEDVVGAQVADMTRRSSVDANSPLQRHPYRGRNACTTVMTAKGCKGPDGIFDARVKRKSWKGKVGQEHEAVRRRETKMRSRDGPNLRLVRARLGSAGSKVRFMAGAMACYVGEL
ncbi:hypothetical protein C8T65DRAFT_781973 [Cerioporus squamosus]|nr:hypothetical protein C8T65DRAFT_781973 [Cerioporus squamosus]